MDPTLYHLGVDLPVESVVQELRRILPNGWRDDQVMSEWCGTYINENNGRTVILKRYMDGYGNTMVVLVEDLSGISYVVVTVSPNDDGHVAYGLRRALKDALEEHIVDSDCYPE